MISKRYYIYIILVLLLIPPIAAMAAEDSPEIRLSSDRLTVGDMLTIDVTDHAKTRAYRLYRGDEQINTGAYTDSRSAALYAQDPGSYRLEVETDDGGRASVAFEIYDQLSLTLTCDAERIRAGETLTVTAQANGGAQGQTYEYSVWTGTERIYAEKSPEAAFAYTPMAEGVYTLTATVTDELGHTAAASSGQITVSGQAGIRVEGDLGPVYGQGAIRTLRVSAPGPWKAQTQDGYITLLRGCGDTGDDLVFAVSASDSERTGTITLTSLGMTRNIRFYQTTESQEEEEISLFVESRDWIAVNGSRYDFMLCQSEQTLGLVSVSASGVWNADCDADWIALEPSADQLRLVVQPNLTSTARNGSIRFQCGNAEAVLGIGQRGLDSGSSVLEVTLDCDHGTAYRDSVSVRVQADASAEAVGLKIDQREPVVYGRAEAASQDGGLIWRFDVPLNGEGGQSWLFYALNGDGSAEKALAAVSVDAEAAAFADAAADADDRGVIVRTTHGAESIEAIDSEGSLLRRYTRQMAFVDYAAGDERYIRWTLPLEGEEHPEALRIADQVIPLRWAETDAVPENGPEQSFFHIYSQMDGTWRKKAYRKSTLEQSGCAIFALSHALQLLGHTEAESLPEQLAKTYAFCLVDGGTLNSTLVGNAGKQFGFKTRFKLYTKKADIIKKFKQGAMFSFGIVQGHIAMIDRLSEDQTMCHIIDSAPTATFSRIQGGTPMRYDAASGQYVALSSPAEIPGLRYYIDTEGYDGAEYWLSLDYVAERGVRLIQPN